jgi:L-alanine-DL-glutamate epimerase-like enolase superfamily enzyme
LEVSAYTVLTETPESDGTFAWSETTLALVQVASCGVVGLGYSFADVATATLIDTHLRPGIVGYNPLNIPELWSSMVRTIRNLGRPGICSMAIAAVDNALWDLKARLLHLCVADLLGRAYPSRPAYGSGGFTSYSNPELKRQLTGWIDDGLTKVKMKLGTDPTSEVARVRSARDAIGPGAELFVDATGAYDRKQALAKASAFADLGVSWFEEPRTGARGHAYRGWGIRLRFVLFSAHA